MRKTKIIGLTGLSGAGKSTAARLFAENGFCVIDADKLVAELYSADSPCLKALAAQFGQDILKPDGTPDRKLLADRAFASKENTQRLNSLVHPFVIAETLRRLKDRPRLAVIDASQLFESGMDVICDAVVSVAADREQRLKRITQRDSISPQRAEQRMNAQLDESFFERNSDFIIHNSGTLEDFEREINRIIAALKGV